MGEEPVSGDLRETLSGEWWSDATAKAIEQFVQTNGLMPVC